MGAVVEFRKTYLGVLFSVMSLILFFWINPKPKPIAVRVQEASVMVTHELPGTDSFLALGSGTAWKVGSRVRISTAAHVLIPYLEPTVVRNGQVFRARVLYKNNATDFAVLELLDAGPYPFVPLPLSFGEVEVGEEVWYSGTPNLNKHLTLHGHYSGVVFESHASTGAMVFDSFAWMGSSGSAIVTVDGGILGSLSHIDVATDNNGDLHLLPQLVFTHGLTEADRFALSF